MSETQHITWRVDEAGVGHIVIARDGSGAKANALGSAQGVQLAQAIGQAAQAAHNGSIGAILICAEGTHFCAGGDIGEFAQSGSAFPSLAQDMIDAIHPALHTLAGLPLPIISAVQGALGGAGIALALCADIVLAADNIKLRGGYSAIGLSPDLGVSYWLARRAGSERAKYILLTNHAIDAAQCLQWGLVDALHPPPVLHAQALALAQQLARGARGAFGRIKHLCETAAHNSLHTHLQHERLALLHCAATADAREGITAFVEKRAPRFSPQQQQP